MTRADAIAKVGAVIAAGRVTITGEEAILRRIIVESLVGLNILTFDEPRMEWAECGCSCADHCPQGKMGMQEKCRIPLPVGFKVVRYDQIKELS